MTSLTHFAEPRAAHGGLAAEGALNLLGRPDLDPLVVLMREAAQNSWDARATEAGPVNFAIRLAPVTPEARKVLVSEIFKELPPRRLGLEGGVMVELEDALVADDLWMMALTDTGTRGLGGPVRADTPVPAGSCTDFVDLVFNIGQPPDREFGGGTYGFGKTISYLVSRCRTVIIHTVTENKGVLEHRLIAQAVGGQYSYKSRNFTGRHWWGTMKPHGVEPLVGRAAAKLAAALGLPDIEAAGGGTTLVVLAPDLSGKTPAQATTFLANALAWNFWPKMVPQGRKTAMSFAVFCDGTPVAVPSPATSPPLNSFAEALKAVRDCEAGRKAPSDFPTMHIFELRSDRPAASLGWLALHAVPVRARRALDQGTDEDGVPSNSSSFSGPAHHVALMRRPELVVQYRPGPELSNPAVEWVGVFKASAIADPAFAEAEPPTHDDWRSNLVSGSWHRRYVNIALKKLKERVAESFGSSTTRQDPGERPSGVVIADALGHLISSHPGTGASSPKRERPESTSSRGATPKVTIARRWFAERDDAPTLNIEFTVAGVAGSAGTSIEVAVAAATADGGSETDPPFGASVPIVLEIVHSGATTVGGKLLLEVDDDEPSTVVISQPRGVATSVDVRATAVATRAPAVILP